MTFRNCTLKRRDDVKGRNAAMRDDAVKKLLDEVLERVAQDQKRMPQAEIREVSDHQLAEYRAKAEARTTKYKRTPWYWRAIGWTLGIAAVIGFFWLAVISLFDPALGSLKAMMLGTLVCLGIAFLVNR
jgi:hypothetical protein